MGSWVQGVLLIFAVVCIGNAVGSGEKCDFFQGKWVEDETYPLYKAEACPFIEREFNCQKNGRMDDLYLKFRWQPNGCALQRFDGQDFLTRFEGKSIMFVGDSLSRNQWQSLTCMLHCSVPQALYNVTRVGDISIFTFMDYDVKVMLDRSVYLVDVVREKIGRVLKLDSIEGGKLWKNIDMLIFNTWHWWNRRGPSQPWDYIQSGKKILKDMDRMVAFDPDSSTHFLASLVSVISMEMGQNSETKWEAKVSAVLKEATADQIWALYTDFFNFHKWFPGLASCYGIHGTNGEPGCIRYCSGFSIKPEENEGDNFVSWSKEKLTAVDPAERSLTYEIVDCNVGFKSYVSTVKITPCGSDGESGCKIDWWIEVDPVQGWVMEDWVKKYEVGLARVARRMEETLTNVTNLEE